jgi:hypothetical protein
MVQMSKRVKIFRKASKKEDIRLTKPEFQGYSDILHQTVEKIVRIV